MSPASASPTECLFCRIVARELPAEILFENDHAIAILDRYPIHHGHALILPKQHFTDLLQLPSDHAGPVMLAVQTVAHALVGSLNLEGFNVFSNNGIIAGQSVFHVHIHVTPRYPDDMVRFAHGQKTYAAGEMSAIAGRIRQYIQSDRGK